MTSQKPQRRLPLAAAVCAALVFSLPACAQTAAVTPVSAVGNQPATVEKNASTGIAKLTVTDRAMERLDLKTDTVKPGPSGTGIVLPYAALMYDANGKTWVYTSPSPKVFQRHEVTVSRVEGGIVTATAGPPVGTAVVTVGAAELFGAEFNTGK
ncbi:MAG: hypothetical protein JWO49_1801 [Arthrobacter sp.]|nr:hypothetical protein [Arthrobacter sp.]MCU1548939.1 hypothetical protein [Arthrobacter sp.]